MLFDTNLDKGIIFSSQNIESIEWSRMGFRFISHKKRLIAPAMRHVYEKERPLYVRIVGICMWGVSIRESASCRFQG
jgi:hypothetical protein